MNGIAIMHRSVAVLQKNSVTGFFAGPGGWNDLDMLAVGSRGKDQGTDNY